MTAALPTRADITHQLLLARAALILAEDACDLEQATEARDLCDRLLDLLISLPEQRAAS